MYLKLDDGMRRTPGAACFENQEESRGWIVFVCILLLVVDGRRASTTLPNYTNYTNNLLPVLFTLLNVCISKHRLHEL
jgi:hypothetical protein